MQLTILIGPSLSGKSYYAEQHKSKNCAVISSDAKRLELGIITHDPTQHHRVFQECRRDIRKALSNGKDVIFDATNLSRRQRRNDIAYFKERFPELKIKGVVFDPGREILLSRIDKRKQEDVNYVTADVIDRQLQKLHSNYPHKSEFDELEIVSTDVTIRQSLQNIIEEVKSKNISAKTNTVQEQEPAI